MWSISNDYNAFGIDGGRPLGEYTEIQRQIALVYNLAQKLGVDAKEIFARIDPAMGEYELGQGDRSVALAYGLKPYIVAPQYAPKSLVPLPMNEQDVPTLSKNMQPNVLRAILRSIVEDA